jgi:hypothetical protein
MVQNPKYKHSMEKLWFNTIIIFLLIQLKKVSALVHPPLLPNSNTPRDGISSYHFGRECTEGRPHLITTPDSPVLWNLTKNIMCTKNTCEFVSVITCVPAEMMMSRRIGVLKFRLYLMKLIQVWLHRETFEFCHICPELEISPNALWRRSLQIMVVDVF